MRVLAIIVSLLIVVLSGSQAAIAYERILAFDSDITVNKDGSLRVIETIQVRAEGRQIKRGIYRSFPVRYKGKDGYWRRVGFKILDVTRDGKFENWFLKSSGDYSLVYLGRKEVYLRPGFYTYKITYKTTRQMRYFNDYDELYWNVTGDKWNFAIDVATARVTLPDGAQIKQYAGYTGRYGQVRKNYQALPLSDNSIRFSTTSGLGARNGLTIAVAWQKGIVEEPSAMEQKLLWAWDNAGFLALILGAFAVVVYYFGAWMRVGRDPKKGIVIPLFGPPDGLSPAAVSYIHYRKLQNQSSGATVAFIAALVSLAVKGRLTIDQRAGNMLLRRTQAYEEPLPRGEAAIFKKLLGSRKTIEFKESTAATVQAARSLFRSAILDEHGDIYFHNNIVYFIFGLLISIASVLGFVFLFGQGEEVIILIAMIIGIWAGATMMFFMGISRLFGGFPGGGAKFFGVVFLIISAALGFAGVSMIMNYPLFSLYIKLALAVLGIANVAFYWLLHAPTISGRAVMDKIEGFKLYLSVAEANRMNLRGAPKVTPEVFEKFLPYAIALGVEKPWSNALEAELQKAKDAGHDISYTPHWYSGTSRWSSRDFGAATAGIVSSVAAGMAEATPPSSSGSGGGGGGFSGGGGGGGGGGGW
jgi:uncharacterized membrane protein YgcG